MKTYPGFPVLPQRLLLYCFCFLVIPRLEAADAKDAKTAEEETVCAVWPVPQDFMERGSESVTAEEGAPTDPFAAPSDSDQTPRKPRSRQHYKHIIPAMGSVAPYDARPLLESLGVTFREGDLALCSAAPADTTLLFVRAHRDQVDVVDTLATGLIGSDPSPHILATYTLRRTAPDGSAEDLIRRSVLCQNGQRSKFQRHRGNKKVEEEELEVTLGEDGATIDVNSTVEFHLAHQVIKSQGQTFLRDGDPAGVLLYRTTDKGDTANLEVIVSARVMRLPLIVDGQNYDPRIYRSKLTDLINSQVISAENLAAESSRRAAEQLTELSYLPYLLHHVPFYPGATDPESWIEAKLPQLGADRLLDMRRRLVENKITLRENDVALYAKESGLLYIHAPASVISAVGGIAGDQPSWIGNKQLEVRFTSWEENHGHREFLPRAVLIRSGQRASGSTAEKGRRREEIDVEGWAGGTEDIADLNLALTSFRMGNETWTMSLQVRTSCDGTAPLTIASGMAKDSGGKMKYVAVSSMLRWHQWMELARDPARKAAAIREIEAALRK